MVNTARYMRGLVSTRRLYKEMIGLVQRDSDADAESVSITTATATVRI